MFALHTTCCSSHCSSHTMNYPIGKIMVSALFWAHSSLSTPCIRWSFYWLHGPETYTILLWAQHTFTQEYSLSVGFIVCLEAIPSWTAALTKLRGLCPCQVHAVREQVHRARLVESFSARWLPTPNHGNLGFFPAEISATFYRASFPLSWDCMGWEMSEVRVLYLLLFKRSPAVSWQRWEVSLLQSQMIKEEPSILGRPSTLGPYNSFCRGLPCVLWEV